MTSEPDGTPTKADLDASTQRLTEMVHTLANALAVQGELQQKTIALTERQTRLDDQAQAAQQHIITAEGELVAIRGDMIPRAEHDQRRRRSRRVAAVTTAVVLVLGALGGWQLHQNEQQSAATARSTDQRNQTNYDNCLVRNRQIAAQVQLWQDERKDAIHYSLPELVASFERAIASEPVPVDCSILLSAKPKKK